MSRRGGMSGTLCFDCAKFYTNKVGRGGLASTRWTWRRARSKRDVGSWRVSKSMGASGAPRARPKCPVGTAESGGMPRAWARMRSVYALRDVLATIVAANSTSRFTARPCPPSGRRASSSWAMRARRSAGRARRVVTAFDRYAPSPGTWGRTLTAVAPPQPRIASASTAVCGRLPRPCEAQRTDPVHESALTFVTLSSIVEDCRDSANRTGLRGLGVSLAEGAVRADRPGGFDTVPPHGACSTARRPPRCAASMPGSTAAPLYDQNLAACLAAELHDAGRADGAGSSSPPAAQQDAGSCIAWFALLLLQSSTPHDARPGAPRKVVAQLAGNGQGSGVDAGTGDGSASCVPVPHPWRFYRLAMMDEGL